MPEALENEVRDRRLDIAHFAQLGIFGLQVVRATAQSMPSQKEHTMGRYGINYDLEQKISELADLPRPDLVERWQTLYHAKPPKGISTRLMVRAIAYEIQAKHYGRLKSTVSRQLDKIASIKTTNKTNGKTRGKTGGKAKGAPWAPALAPGSLLSPGARLVREWNGAVHTVDVTDDGFEWQDQKYRSLSEIAREITGARWSGPRFFGLNGRSLNGRSKA